MLVAGATMPGCCCDSGPDRLLRVEIDDERDALREEVVFDADNEFPQNAVLEPYFYGEVDGGLSITPLIELFDETGAPVLLARENEDNDGGCALVERYVPPADLVMGERLTLVHRASRSPGALEEAGSEEGSLRGAISSFSGEPALVATLWVVEPIEPPMLGAGGGGGSFDPGAGGAAP